MNPPAAAKTHAQRIALDLVAFVLLATAVGLGAGVTLAGIALLFSAESAADSVRSSRVLPEADAANAEQRAAGRAFTAQGPAVRSTVRSSRPLAGTE